MFTDKSLTLSYFQRLSLFCVTSQKIHSTYHPRDKEEQPVRPFSSWRGGKGERAKGVLRRVPEAACINKERH